MEKKDNYHEFLLEKTIHNLPDSKKTREWSQNYCTCCHYSCCRILEASLCYPCSEFTLSVEFDEIPVCLSLKYHFISQINLILSKKGSLQFCLGLVSAFIPVLVPILPSGHPALRTQSNF